MTSIVSVQVKGGKKWKPRGGPIPRGELVVYRPDTGRQFLSSAVCTRYFNRC